MEEVWLKKKEKKKGEPKELRKGFPKGSDPDEGAVMRVRCSMKGIIYERRKWVEDVERDGEFRRRIYML